MYDLINLLSYAIFMLVLAAVIGYCGWYLAQYIRKLPPPRQNNFDVTLTRLTRDMIEAWKADRERTFLSAPGDRASLGFALLTVRYHLHYARVKQSLTNNPDETNYLSGQVAAWQHIESELSRIMQDSRYHNY